MKRLATYRKKRQPQETPEPMESEFVPGDTLCFVVQKHKASHLHYDLRLELDGVLRSFALPKGFPYSDGEKRIAVEVEDHPFAYKDFEGEIPEGNYGAGLVEIWDEGNYSTTSATKMSEAVRQLREGFKKGHLALILNGTKLSGVFHLVRAPQKNQSNSWLIFRSAKKKINPEKIPKSIFPMLAYPVEKAFKKEGWIFEIKWDGYRTLAEIDKGKINLYSRNHKLFTKKFSPITNDLSQLDKHDLVLDGEVVVLDEMGRSSFSSLQNCLLKKEGSLYFYVFDLLYCDGQDLRTRPLIERKERLELLLYPLRKSRIRYCDHVEKNGTEFFSEIKKRGLEGIIAKKASSSYQEGRSRDWLKIRASSKQEFVIGGFTHSEDRPHLSSLMLGVFSDDKLTFAGLVGSGFSDVLLKNIASKLRSIITTESPFKNHPKLLRKVTFVKPVLVCEVSFTEMTKDGLLRHPVFLGLREDKEAKDVKSDAP